MGMVRQGPETSDPTRRLGPSAIAGWGGERLLRQSLAPFSSLPSIGNAALPTRALATDRHHVLFRVDKHLPF